MIEMPLGKFLDTMPAGMFIIAHVLFLAVGVWAAKKTMKLSYAGAFWLYVVSQLVFLGFFARLFTIKMAVLFEQTLLVIMVIWIASKSRET